MGIFDEYTATLGGTPGKLAILNIKAGEITLPWISKSDTVYTLSTTNQASSKTNNVTHPITHSLTHTLAYSLHSVLQGGLHSTWKVHSIITFLSRKFESWNFWGSECLSNFFTFICYWSNDIGDPEELWDPNKQYPKQKHYIRWTRKEREINLHIRADKKTENGIPAFRKKEINVHMRAGNSCIVTLRPRYFFCFSLLFFVPNNTFFIA